MRDPEREHRLRLDDCSSLAGLLCDLLGVPRWDCFFRAINVRPLCSKRYELTGDRELDEHLSAIVNRAWLGDADGAMAVASGKGWSAGYDDARELLADVAAVLMASLSGVGDEASGGAIALLGCASAASLASLPCPRSPDWTGPTPD